MKRKQVELHQQTGEVLALHLSKNILTLSKLKEESASLKADIAEGMTASPAVLMYKYSEESESRNFCAGILAVYLCICSVCSRAVCSVSVCRFEV